MTLLEYKIFVENLSSANKDAIFMNSDIDYDSIVLAEIFRRSVKMRDEVCIFAGNLDLGDDVYAKYNYTDSIQQFVKRGGKLRIILNAYNKNASSIVDTLLAMDSRNVEIRKSKIRLTDATNKEIHFTVAGGSFRYEYDIANHSVMCNFNDTEKASKLKDIFEKCWEDKSTIGLEDSWSEQTV